MEKTDNENVVKYIDYIESKECKKIWFSIVKLIFF